MKEIDIDYRQLIPLIQAKGLLLQYKETDTFYELFAVESNICWSTRIEVGSDNANDFEANFKSTANQPLEYRSSDGLIKIASAKFADTLSFIADGSNGVMNAKAGQVTHAKTQITKVFKLSGVDAFWSGANLGDYVDFEVGFYLDISNESTFQALGQFGNRYSIYKDGFRQFDVQAVKTIPPTVTVNGVSFDVYIRTSYTNVGQGDAVFIVNLIGWQ